MLSHHAGLLMSLRSMGIVDIKQGYVHPVPLLSLSLPPSLSLLSLLSLSLFLSISHRRAQKRLVVWHGWTCVLMGVVCGTCGRMGVGCGTCVLMDVCVDGCGVWDVCADGRVC